MKSILLFLSSICLLFACITFVADELTNAKLEDYHGRKFSISTENATYPYYIRHLSAFPGHRMAKTVVSTTTILRMRVSFYDFNRYRVIVFGTTYCITDEEMAYINGHVKKDGRMVIFNYAPAYTDGTKLDVGRIGAITEMEVRPVCIATPPVVTFKDKDYGLEANGLAGLVPVAPLFEITDKEVQILGRYKDLNVAAVAMKKQTDYTVVYAALPLRNPDLMRELFREAGAHIYNEANDVVIAGGGIVCVATKENEGGHRVIRLRNGRNIAFEMKSGSTVIFDAETGEEIF